MGTIEPQTAAQQHEFNRIHGRFKTQNAWIIANHHKSMYDYVDNKKLTTQSVLKMMKNLVKEIDL